MKSWLGSVTNVTHRRRHYDYPPQLHWETLMSEFRFSIDMFVPVKLGQTIGHDGVSANISLQQLGQRSTLEDPIDVYNSAVILSLSRHVAQCTCGHK